MADTGCHFRIRLAADAEKWMKCKMIFQLIQIEE